ncbi:MAG: hypothetical protein CMN94_05805 [Synechococcus sp. EAC657]|nr:hypothetical protein [Synechococcus sp. EAC657]
MSIRSVAFQPCSISSVVSSLLFPLRLITTSPSGLVLAKVLLRLSFLPTAKPFLSQTVTDQTAPRHSDANTAET